MQINLDIDSVRWQELRVVRRVAAQFQLKSEILISIPHCRLSNIVSQHAAALHPINKRFLIARERVEVLVQAAPIKFRSWELV